MNEVWEDTVLEILADLPTDATPDKVEAEVGRRLHVLGRREFAGLAHALLDAAERLVDLGQPDAARRLASAVKKSVRITAQRSGETGAYSEPIASRGRAFLAFVHGRPR